MAKQTISPETSSPKLYKPFKLGAYELSRQVALAPMTRLRTIQPGDIPSPKISACIIAFLAPDEARRIAADIVHVDGGAKL